MITEPLTKNPLYSSSGYSFIRAASTETISASNGDHVKDLMSSIKARLVQLLKLFMMSRTAD
jgi:hypothetical protein